MTDYEPKDRDDDFVKLMLAVAFLASGFVFGCAVSKLMSVSPCESALLESCKQNGGNQLDGLECVKVDVVKVTGAH